MRERRGLWTLCGALLFLFLLAALVETPADREARESAPRQPSPPVVAALAPGSPLWEDRAQSPSPPFQPFAPGLAAALTLTLPAFCRDANGRWIRKKRYVDSVYQVFRQEAACG